jgi:hypothetical protein
MAAGIGKILKRVSSLLGGGVVGSSGARQLANGEHDRHGAVDHCQRRASVIVAGVGCLVNNVFFDS